MDLFSAYPKKFYARPTLDVARDLLGATLCRKLPDQRLLYGSIVEVEAYTQDDPACHAFAGLTKRTSVLFGPPGNAYVYFIYGMYYCLNVVTEKEGTAGAVLIRAVAAAGTNGPGKLCRQWEIDFAQNGMSLMNPDSELWISPGDTVDDDDICVSARIGISSAQEYPWRFYLKDHPAVSPVKTKPKAKTTNGRRKQTPKSR